jgi:hypothetical protein
MLPARTKRTRKVRKSSQANGGVSVALQAAMTDRPQRSINFAGLQDNPSGFPKKLAITHKYCEVVSMASALGAPAVYQFQANGLFDPNSTGTGHQPMYFDNCAAIYDQYTVFASRIQYQILSDVPFLSAVYIDDDGTAAAGPQVGAEQADSRPLKLNPITTFRPVTYKKSWNAKDYFGGDIFDNDQLSGSIAGNPGEQSLYTLLVQPVTAVNGTFSVAVDIWYDTVWDEIKTQAAN